MSKPYVHHDVPLPEFPKLTEHPGKLNVAPLNLPDINSPKPRRK
jgi:hypothetical protein